jgi:sugar transferase (PEP-CTERM/EpsH1 system associated)
MLAWRTMKLLWLKSDLLFPLDKGGRLRTWHLLRRLATRHEITYLAFAPPGASEEASARMRTVVADLQVVPRADPPKRSLRFYAGAALRMLDPLPYAIGTYRSRAFRQRIRRLVREQAFDLIVCDFVLPAVNLPSGLPCPVVIFTHNVESEIWRRHAETQTSRLLRRLYAIQHRRMLRFERRALARADGVLAVSDADRDTLVRLYPDAVREPVSVVPTGVDTDYFQPRASPADGRSLVFTGSMDWLPNEDAMIFFCRDVLPRIRAAEPRATLTIVGRAPTPRVARLATEHGVIVTGRVDDVRPYMADAAVYVVPLRIGGGTRLKIFEALAMGKAVVSTTIGAEGLPVTDGTHLVLADGPHAFASAVVDLVRGPDRRRALETAARRLVVERYDWSAAAEALDQALGRAAHARFTRDRGRAGFGTAETYGHQS